MTKEFVYSDLFELKSPTEKISKLDFVADGSIPAYSSDTTNNGCLGYVDREPTFKVSAEIPAYIVFGDHTKTMNIVRTDFCVLDNVKVLVPKQILTDEMLLYVLTVWKKAIPDLGYARHWSKAQEVEFELPVIPNPDATHDYTVDDIDWQTMVDSIIALKYEHIAEIESKHIEELGVYLQVAELKSYELTDTDKNTISTLLQTPNLTKQDLWKALATMH